MKENSRKLFKILFVIFIMLIMLYLAIQGFRGKLSPFVAGMGWSIVLIDEITARLREYLEKEKEKKNKIETF